MGTLNGSWIWYEIVTPDPDGAKAFYDAVVGWNIMPTHADNPDYGFIVNADGGMTGGLLRLSKDMTDAGMRPMWLGYIGVDDVDAAVVAIEAKGGKTWMPARDIEMAGRVALVSDPSGAPFYVMTPTPPPGGGESTAFSETLMGRCSWNELVSGDLDNALEFYTSLFGWGLPEPMDMGPMGQYHFITHDAVQVGALMKKPDEMPFPAWNHYFRVQSIDAAIVAVQANGGTVMMGPMEVPGDDLIMMGTDPQGAAFALVGAK